MDFKFIEKINKTNENKHLKENSNGNSEEERLDLEISMSKNLRQI